MALTKTIMLLVTYGCNLRCAYCYEPKTERRDMTADDAMRYIRRTVESLGPAYDSFEVQFMGGEPLMAFPVVREVCERLWNAEWPVRLERTFVVTNGTLLHKCDVDWIDRNSRRLCLGISFDGTATMQNLNRSGSASAVDLGFFASRWPDQAVKMTVSPRSAPMLAEGVGFLHSQGFRNVVVDLAMGPNAGWKPTDLHVVSRQLEKLRKLYIADRSLTPCSLFRVDIFDLVDDADVSEGRQLFKHCSCGETLVCIDVDGGEYACHLFSPVACPADRAESSREIDFTDVSSLANPDCLGCSLDRICTFCYGMNYSSTGSTSAQDPFVCAAFRTVYLQNCLFRRELAAERGDDVEVAEIDSLIRAVAEIQ